MSCKEEVIEIFKEKITRRQALCSLLAFAGVVLINL